MNTFLQLLDRGSAQILAPLKRFPLASFSAFIFILLVSIDMYFRFDHTSFNPYAESVKQIAMVAFLGFFFLLGLRLMTKNIFVSLLGVLILVGFYFYLPESLNGSILESEGEIIFSMLLVGLFSFIIVAPFLTYKSSNRAFFEWLKHFLYTVYVTALVSIILFVILNVALSILSGLFEIADTYRNRKFFNFFSFAVFAPYLFLSLLTKEPRTIAIKSYNKLETFFFKYFLSGLFIAYFIIIYTYLGKMIMLSEYPKGMVSVNILAFSALAIMTYLFWTPLWNEKNSKYKKVIWIAILLQVILLVVALYLRVDAYAWTFGRLLLATFGLWLFALSLYALLKKEISFRGIFIALPIIILFNLLFASSISKGSQQEKLSMLLGSENTFSDDTNISLRYNISSTIEYLYAHHGTDAFYPLMPEIVSEFKNQQSDVLDNCAIPTNSNFPSFATEKLGFEYINKWEWRQKVNYEKYERRMKSFHIQGNPVNRGLNLSKYDWIVGFDYQKSEVFSAVLVCEPKSTSTVKEMYTLRTEGKEIIILEEKEVLASINIEEFIQQIIKLDANDKSVYRPFNDDFTQEEFTYLYEDDKVKVKFLFNRFSFTLKNELINYGGLVMVGKK